MDSSEVERDDRYAAITWTDVCSLHLLHFHQPTAINEFLFQLISAVSQQDGARLQSISILNLFA